MAFMGMFGQNAAERSEGDDAGDAHVGVLEWTKYGMFEDLECLKTCSNSGVGWQGHQSA